MKLHNALLFALAASSATLVYGLWPSGSPKLVVDPAIIEFGEIAHGREYTRSATLMNVGNASLSVSAVRTGCGCASVSLERSVIPPKQSAKLDVTLVIDGAAARAGRVLPILVTSNDPVNEHTRILAKVDRAGGEPAHPKLVDFGQISGRDALPVTRAIRITSKHAKNTDLVADHTSLIPHCDKPYVATICQRQTPGSDQMTVTLLEDTPLGDIYFDILLEDSDRGNFSPMTVRANVYGLFVAVPAMITVGPLNRGDPPVVETVRVFRRTGDDRLRRALLMRDAVRRVHLSESLKNVVSIAPDSAGQGEDAWTLSIIVDPQNCAGAWSTSRICGDILLTLGAEGGPDESLNIPVIVTTKAPRIH